MISQKRVCFKGIKLMHDTKGMVRVMERLARWLKTNCTGGLSGICRFPVSMALSALTTALLLTLLNRENLADTGTWLIQATLVAGLGIPLSISLHLLLERFAQRQAVFSLPAWVAMAGLLALYLFLLPQDIGSAQNRMRYAALFLAAVALIPAVPYLFGRHGGERFALALLLRALAAVLLTCLLAGGLCLLLLMLERLLPVRLGANVYAGVAVVSLGLFAPAYLLAGIPLGKEDLESELFPRLVIVLAGAIAFPLLAACTAILYAFLFRALLLRSLPANTLAGATLLYAAVGMTALYLMRQQITANRWFRLFGAWFPRLAALPVLLAITGLLIRIRAYGFTERRYFALIFAAWVLAAIIMAIARKPERRHSAAMPALFSLTAILAVLGPWGAFPVSAASQSVRLKALLQQNDMLSATGTVIAKQGVPLKDKQRIYNILYYYDRFHGLDEAGVLPPGTKLEDFSRLLGFGSGGSAAASARFFVASDYSADLIDLAGFDCLYVGNSDDGKQIERDGIVMGIDHWAVFSVERDGLTVYEIDLKEYARSLQTEIATNASTPARNIIFLDQNDNVRVQFIINEAAMAVVNGRPVFSVPSFIALVDIKD
jgi:hypothetical protein